MILRDTSSIAVFQPWHIGLFRCPFEPANRPAELAMVERFAVGWQWIRQRILVGDSATRPEQFGQILHQARIELWRLRFHFHFAGLGSFKAWHDSSRCLDGMLRGLLFGLKPCNKSGQCAAGFRQ